MSIFKKAAAFLTAVGIAASYTACGYNTRSAMTVDGVEIPAGVYIYYANNAYNQALSKLSEENPDLDTTDKNAVKEQLLEGKDVLTWVQDEATKMCTEYAVIEKKFDELGLSLDADSKSTVSMMKDYYWTSSQEAMEKNGISEASFEKIVTSSYKSDKIFKYYYAIGGENGTTDEEVYNYYKENNIRAEYLAVSLKDGEGNLLKSDGKKDMMTMVEGYRDRVEEALAEGGVKAVKEEMDKIREDYQAYQDSLTAEESETDEEADTEPETVGETDAETTTAADEDAETAEEETSEDTTEETDEDTASTEPSTVIDDVPADLVDDTKADEENAETADESDETDAEDEETDAETSEETEEETDEASDEDETEDEEAPEAAEDADEEDTTEEETDGEDEETASDEDGADGEDEETDPYQNESIISVIHEEDYDDPEDIHYNPSENAYRKLVSIEAKDYGKPYIVEDDEVYYLVVRYDIEDRMVANDLWTDSTKENVVNNMFDKDFQDLIDGWTASASVQRNEAAYKRYDPYKFDFS